LINFFIDLQSNQDLGSKALYLPITKDISLKCVNSIPILLIARVCILIEFLLILICFVCLTDFRLRFGAGGAAGQVGRGLPALLAGRGLR